jgi:hypothetical protein
MKPAFVVFLKANCPTQLKPVSSDRTVLSFSLPNAAPSLMRNLEINGSIDLLVAK